MLQRAGVPGNDIEHVDVASACKGGNGPGAFFPQSDLSQLELPPKELYRDCSTKLRRSMVIALR
jgi:hypothetical protein